MGFGLFHRAHGAGAQMALEGLNANVMLADADLRITFVNQALTKLLKEAEADLRKELPNFSVATLIGSNIDISTRPRRTSASSSPPCSRATAPRSASPTGAST